uniref:Uncharacterized protein n=1 Tax=Siphoviridae sp. ctCsv15 TaxID=2826195 RepID=A0A8S5LZD1_9CAUD|nr:MAG TPA: hypothetical protein [Siphoviridae sp. ctCsv15]
MYKFCKTKKLCFLWRVVCKGATNGSKQKR